MRAARYFGQSLKATSLLELTDTVVVHLFGSLASTGRGHGTDTAILLGLEGADPETVEPETIKKAVKRINISKRLMLLGELNISFDVSTHLVFLARERLPRHPNGMRFFAFGRDGLTLCQEDYYSIGGGFVLRGDQEQGCDASRISPRHNFQTADELLRLCRTNNCSIHDIVMANERSWRTDEDIICGLRHVWRAMQACVSRGFEQTGILPGGLKVRRRAQALFESLNNGRANDALHILDWVNAWALAVNEENAAGGRVVTAPTNGAAGIVPAVIHYYERFEIGANEDGVFRFLVTAGVIAMLYKRNASISGAEMGCQGEVGVACSMAAAGLVAALNGTNAQIENAAEIGMEHNLGLTCDPVAGLVQIPCIERNAMGAIKAINAARLAMHGDGNHRVSLDQVIATMRQTGRDMSTVYKETSLGGLAVNVPEC
jgi:L-serine dehydratase